MRNILSSFYILVVLFAFHQLTPFSAQAQYFNGPVVTALGGSGRASLDPLEGSFLNPAGLALLDNYYMGISWTDSSDISNGQERDFTAIVADSTPDKVIPAAVAYTKRRITNRGQAQVDQKNYHIALANRVLQQLAIGLSFHRLESEIDAVEHNQHNFSLGMLFAYSENLGFALVGSDLLSEDDDIPSEVRLRSEVAIGMTYVLENLVQGRMDLAYRMKDNPDNEMRLMMGLESVVHEFFTVRGGAQWDDLTKQTFLSLGFGFTGPKLGFDYVWQKEISPEEGGHRHLIDLKLKF